MHFALISPQNHWFTYNEPMTVESVTQSLSNLALAFGKMDITKGTMVSFLFLFVYCLRVSFYRHENLFAFYFEFCANFALL